MTSRIQSFTPKVMSLYPRSLIWIRRDLRLDDLRVAETALAQSKEAAFVFVFDNSILKDLSENDRRVSFIFDALQELDHRLQQEYGSGLLLTHGLPQKVIPSLVSQLQCSAVFAAQDTDPVAKSRDAHVEINLAQIQCAFHLLQDTLLFEPSEIQTRSNTPYRVYTPFKKACLSTLTKDHIRESRPDYSRLTPRSKITPHSLPFDLSRIGFKHITNLFIPSGEKNAHLQLERFLSQAKNYEKTRNFPSLAEGTSLLSPHLRFGTLSIRTCVRSLYAAVRSKKDREAWLNELLWREFFHHILDHYPMVVDRPFRSEYQTLKWENNSDFFEAWKAGKTGYPIVDAAMRHFKKTGWMHNRLRMIVASFLTKDLLIDWRWGEHYFASLLLDYDLAQNNGNWQWSASTGCDAQPYFRIFNPTEQAKRFDPEGIFIRSMLPERAKHSNKQVHLPESPIVNHDEQRKKALAMFKAVR